MKTVNYTVFGILLSFLLGLLFYKYGQSIVTDHAIVGNVSGTNIYPAKSLPDISLKNSDSQDQSIDFVVGRWSLLYLGYTSCPDICPVTLSYLKKELSSYSSMLDRQDLQVVFVSVDPERDLKKAGTYAKSFDPRFLGYSGSVGEIDKLANFFTSYVGRRLNQKDPKDYLVDHPGQIFVVDPHGRWVKSFAPPFDEGEVLRGLQESFEGFEKSPEFKVTDAWIRKGNPSLGDSYTTAGYGLVQWRSKDLKEDELQGIFTKEFRRSEIHRTVLKDNIHSMEAVESLGIRSGESIAFEPGALHWMFIQNQSQTHESIVVKFEFKNSGAYRVRIPIREQIAKGEDGHPNAAEESHKHHDHHSM